LDAQASALASSPWLPTVHRYKSAAMDVEFMRLAGKEEAYELVEINSR
jgi:hypothetical protein